MNARELRIGNWILDTDNGDEYQVVEITENGFVAGPMEVYPAGMEGNYGIPLTAEWLTRFGFKESSNNLVFDHPAPAIPENEYKDLGTCYPAFFFNKRPEVQKWMDCHTRVTVEYVHQLQNLYFALTGSELTLK